MKPTDQEIQDEITALQTMKPKVRKISGFGDNHHDAIDAQVRVLKERMRESRVWDVYGDRIDNVLDSAKEAQEWLEDADNAKPSDGWKELVIE